MSCRSWQDAIIYGSSGVPEPDIEATFASEIVLFFVLVAVEIEPESEVSSVPPILLEEGFVFWPVSPIEGVPDTQEGSSGAQLVMAFSPPESWIGEPDSKRTIASPARATNMMI